MIFFSRQMSERLASLGCKSESCFYYAKAVTRKEAFAAYFSNDPEEYNKPFYSKTGIDPQPHIFTYVPAFYQNDLTGCHQQAWENSRIVWGQGHFCLICFTPFLENGIVLRSCKKQGFICMKSFRESQDHHRHGMINITDAEKYLEETMRIR